MKKTLALINEFEKRNNISIVLQLCSDGSGRLLEFWDEEDFFHFTDIESLHKFLKEAKCKLSVDGRCFSPVQIIKD